MTAAFSIDPATGAVRIGDAGLLAPNQSKDSVEPAVARFLTQSRDLGNGYEWLTLGGLTFGGQPATLSLCFHDHRFEQASWSVQPPDAPMEGGWPTREAIDAELSFVRKVLTQDMGLHVGKTAWGEVWSRFDARGFLAGNGLRYRST